MITTMPVNGTSVNVGLDFGKEGGLYKIQVVLHESRSFWENFTADDLEQTMMQFKRFYAETINLYVSRLGAPDFSGNWGDKDYPADQNAWSICFWNLPEGRLQIEFDQPDKEFPFFVRVVCYPVNPSLCL